MKKLLIIFVLLLACMSVYAVPAKPGTFMVTQPDGTTFMAKLWGDEFLHVMMTADGCAIEQGTDGYYQYLTFLDDGSSTPSGHHVGAADTPVEVLSASRRIPYQILRRLAVTRKKERAAQMTMISPSSVSSPKSVGKSTCIVLLVQFTDRKFNNAESRQQEFDDLFNKVGYSESSATGSVKDYFEAQFLGTREFSFVVGPIVTASNTLSYYGGNSNGFDQRPQELVAEACTLSDPYVDFSQFDDNGDGVVDNLIVIAAGMSEAEGASSIYIWPHQWAIYSSLVLDGKKIQDYAMSTELGNYSSGWSLTRIGSICHEFGHQLGLPDLYDTDYEESGGTSNALWFYTGVMDGGCYNNESRTPPYYNAIDRDVLNIGICDTLKAGSYTLDPINEEGRYLKMLNPSNPDEYFLIECRSGASWDGYIGGQGLALYHIDMSENEAGYSSTFSRDLTALERWEYSEINCNPYYECADMMEASAAVTTVAGVFFPYRSIKTITPKSNPYFVFNDGSTPEISLANITIDGSKVEFLAFDSSLSIPEATNIQEEIYQDAAIITWEAPDTTLDWDATVSWGQIDGSKTSTTVYSYETGKYAVRLDNLSPTQTYSYTITFSFSDIQGAAVSKTFMTKSLKSSAMPYIDFEYVTRNSDGSFSGTAKLPLRLYNAVGAKVYWFFDGRSVAADASGYYTTSTSGRLKAEATLSDGRTINIVKDITVK